jgi:hypothetical protein
MAEGAVRRRALGFCNTRTSREEGSGARRPLASIHS